MRLDLLVPWELPLDQPLTGRDRECVSQALQQLVQALRGPVVEQTLQQLEQALADLGEIAGGTATATRALCQSVFEFGKVAPCGLRKIWWRRGGEFAL